MGHTGTRCWKGPHPAGREGVTLLSTPPLPLLREGSELKDPSSGSKSTQKSLFLRARQAGVSPGDPEVSTCKALCLPAAIGIQVQMASLWSRRQRGQGGND